MIDLENLAIRRSGELGQAPQGWKEAVRQPVFTEMSSLLTDGEIISFISSCNSPEILLICSGRFVESSRRGEEEPFADFLESMRSHSGGDIANES